MIKIVDDRHRELWLARAPRRVVSLVPSDTETIFALGAGDRLIARTDYCVEPAGSVDGIPTVGGTKNPDVDRIVELAPDLVLANQEENARAPLERLARAGIAVLVAFPRRAGDALAHVARIARALGVEREPAATRLLRRGYAALRAAEAQAASARPLRVFAPIWLDPLMTFCGDTYASDVLRLAGAVNVFSDRTRRYPLAADLGNAAPADPGERDVRYPRVTLDEVRARAPDVVLLPDEPYAFGPADADRFAALGVPAVPCDGKDLFWHGARTVDAVERLGAQVAALRAAGAPA
ncbi:MAG: ABC transporter substrate-binding protein [Deltaproteobacteria bacterium]|nr:MAG: ABC transporter substrate-binding protein [Deltaproteobacteria bacterium]